MDSISRWKNLQDGTRECRLCRLSQSRQTVVFGEGNEKSPVVFIGEAPGKEEDLKGRPFVGKSGQVLTAAIEEVFQQTRSQIYITNIVKCRPTVNFEKKKDRQPFPEEIQACLPILQEQLELISPRILIALGATATKSIFKIAGIKSPGSITEIRGNWFSWNGRFILPTFHPSYILRNGGIGSRIWETFKTDIESAKKKWLSQPPVDPIR